MERLCKEEIEKEIEFLLDWKFIDDKLEKQFLFKNFIQALSFMVQVGMLAEKQNHHPEFINVYNSVNIRLSTLDANGITTKDIDLAKAINKL